jgi:hypothetical protein
MSSPQTISAVAEGLPLDHELGGVDILAMDWRGDVEPLETGWLGPPVALDPQPVMRSGTVTRPKAQDRLFMDCSDSARTGVAGGLDPMT